MPKISVVMSTYKEKEKDLRLAIESILDQTFSDFEFIIVLDNPENSMHEKVINEYRSKDERIIFLKNSVNIGLALSLNEGIKKSKTEIIARMDADDISKKDRLERELNYLYRHPEYTVISVNKEIIDGDNNVLNVGGVLPTSFEQTKRGMKYISMVLHPGSMFYKKEIIDLGGYRDFSAAQDYDLWLRVIASGKRIGFLDEYLLYYRENGENISTKKTLISWTCHKLIAKLYRERMKKGWDSYSKEYVEAYLHDHGCDNEESLKRFSESYILQCQARKSIKDKKYYHAIIQICKSILLHRESKWFILNSIMYKVVMRKER